MPQDLDSKARPAISHLDDPSGVNNLISLMLICGVGEFPPSHLLRNIVGMKRDVCNGWLEGGKHIRAQWNTRCWVFLGSGGRILDWMFVAWDILVLFHLCARCVLVFLTPLSGVCSATPPRPWVSVMKVRSELTAFLKAMVVGSGTGMSAS